MRSPRRIQCIAIIGFGEVGGIFGNDFAKQGMAVSVFDLLLGSRQHRQKCWPRARNCGVEAVDKMIDCLRHAELVISAVTASSSLDVAEQAAGMLRRGQLFLDINSVSPETKRRAALHVEPSGADFVEAAVMAPVPGSRLKVPMLLGGRHADVAAERLRMAGMSATALSDQIGVASAVKMCRSIIVKSFEALAVECFFAARRYGAEEPVLDSLAASYASVGWRARLPDYLISRVAEHGRRRAVEMREVAQALEEVGIEPTMALATARRQEQPVSAMAARKLPFASGQPFSWRLLADAIGALPATRIQRKSAR